MWVFGVYSVSHHLMGGYLALSRIHPPKTNSDLFVEPTVELLNSKCELKTVISIYIQISIFDEVCVCVCHIPSEWWIRDPFDPLQIPSVLVPKHGNFRVASGWSCLCTCLVARRGRTRGFRGSIFASEWWFETAKCWDDINIVGVVNTCQICDKCMGNIWYVLHTFHEGIVWEAW